MKVLQEQSSSMKGPRTFRLRYIGLSHVQLTSTAFMSILLSICANISSVTHIDFSNNEIGHLSDDNFFQTFLSTNKTLRVLDLCHNKIDEKTLKNIYLGELFFILNLQNLPFNYSILE